MAKDNDVVKPSVFGGDTRFPDDMGFLAYLLDKEWYLPPKEHPGYIYFDERGLVRDNGRGGFGSIYIYSLGMNEGTITAINYQSKKFTHNIVIDTINKYKPRNQAWTDAILNILDYYRASGREKLNGWDYLTVTSVKKKTGFTDFYGSVIELQLVKEVKTLKYDGRANISLRDYLKEQKNTVDNTEEQSTEEGEGTP